MYNSVFIFVIFFVIFQTNGHWPNQGQTTYNYGGQSLYQRPQYQNNRPNEETIVVVVEEQPNNNKYANQYAYGQGQIYRPVQQYPGNQQINYQRPYNRGEQKYPTQYNYGYPNEGIIVVEVDSKPQTNYIKPHKKDEGTIVIVEDPNAKWPYYNNNPYNDNHYNGPPKQPDHTYNKPTEIYNYPETTSKTLPTTTTTTPRPVTDPSTPAHGNDNYNVPTTKKSTYVPLDPNEYIYGGDKINLTKKETDDKKNDEEFPIDIRFQDQ